MSTLIDHGSVAFAGGADQQVDPIPSQGAMMGEFFAVSVANTSDQTMTVDCIATEYEDPDESTGPHDFVLVTFDVEAGAAVSKLVEGWLVTESKIGFTPGAAATGDVFFWVRQNT